MEICGIINRSTYIGWRETGSRVWVGDQWTSGRARLFSPKTPEENNKDGAVTVFFSIFFWIIWLANIRFFCALPASPQASQVGWGRASECEHISKQSPDYDRWKGMWKNLSAYHEPRKQKKRHLLPFPIPNFSRWEEWISYDFLTSI